MGSGYAYNERPPENKFFAIGNRISGSKAYDTEKNEIISFYIRAHDESITYARETYTLVDALALVGGFYKFVLIFFNLLLWMFIENMFFSSIMQKIYQIQTHKSLKYITSSEIEGTISKDTISESLICYNQLEDNKDPTDKEKVT